MESVDPHDRYLDPPDEEYTAECEICGERRECSDMRRVGDDDVWVCDLLGTDCLSEYIQKHQIP